jgi:GAF domain-containing protein
MEMQIRPARVGVREQARAEAALGSGDADGARLRKAVAAFARVAGAGEEVQQLDDLLHVVARQICELVGVERCSIHLRDERAGLFVGCVCYAGAPIRSDDIKRSRAGVPADGMTAELLRTKRPVIIGNAHDDPRTVKSTVRFWQIHSIMAVPMIFRDEVIGVIFLDDIDRPHVFSTADAEIASTFGDLAAVTVMHAQSRAELVARVASTQRQIQSLRRATVVDERLSDLVLEGGSLQQLLDALSELMGKPSAVFDVDGVRLATAVPPGTADGLAPRVLEPPYVTSPEVQEALAAAEGRRVFLVGPLPLANVLHRHAVAPVIVAGEVWGRLVVMEHMSRFAGGDMLTLRRAATLIALHVSAERQAIEADWNAGASLAAELLDGSAHRTQVRRRAERLGVDLDAPRVVMLIAPRTRMEASALDFRRVAAAVSEVAPDLTFLATAVSGGVAVLVELDAEAQADPAAFVRRAKLVLERVDARLLPAGRLVAGVSGVCRSRGGYRAAYTDALHVVDCIKRFSPPDGLSIFSADELGAGGLFLATSDRDLVTACAEQTFGALVDDPTKADLVTTLCGFFDNMASIRRCAVHLGVHENTIRYRLARIEELTGLAVTHDPDAQLRARLSLLVLLLQGRLPTS